MIINIDIILCSDKQGHLAFTSPVCHLDHHVSCTHTAVCFISRNKQYCEYSICAHYCLRIRCRLLPPAISYNPPEDKALFCFGLSWALVSSCSLTVSSCLSLLLALLFCLVFSVSAVLLVCCSYGVDSLSSPPCASHTVTHGFSVSLHTILCILHVFTCYPISS